MLSIAEWSVRPALGIQLNISPNIALICGCIVQIMLPSMLCGHWTLYAWDMEKRRINVLDPVLGKESREVQSAVHSRIIGDLHDKLFDCIFDLFTGLEDDRSSYKIVFYNLAHRPSKK